MKPVASRDTESELRRNAMQLLAGADRQSRQAAEEVASGRQWLELFDLCGQWKLLSSLEARLALLGIALPAAEAAELARRTQPPFVQTMLCIRAGVGALLALEHAGIRCAGFKGLAALAYLYPTPRNRTLQDVDVLIHPDQLEAALQVLEETGFKRDPDIPWSEYIAFVRNSPGTAGNEAVSLKDERGGAVDLHWRLGGLDVDVLLAGAGPVEVLKRRVPLLSAGHCMLLSVHHALRNDFVPGDIARDVCDFARWQPLLSETEQWPALSADAEQWGLSAACAALASIVAGIQGAPKADSPLPASRANRAAARELCALYFRQLLAGPINTDLAYVASTRPLRQVATGLAGGWKEYRNLMRRSEALNGEVSLPLRARLWKLGKACAGLSPRGWRQVRVLARAKDKMAGPQQPR